MSIAVLMVDISTIWTPCPFLLPRALAVVAERTVAFPHRVAPADLLGPGHEVEPFLGVAGDAVEDEPEQPAGVRLVLVASDVVEHPLHHLELIEGQPGDALRERGGPLR